MSVHHSDLHGARGRPLVAEPKKKRRKGQGDAWDVADVRNAFTEVLGFARICAETWKATAKEPESDESTRWTHGLGVERLRYQRGEPMWTEEGNNFAETVVSCQTRAVDRFVELIERIVDPTRGPLPNRWDSADDRYRSERSLLELLINDGMPDLTENDTYYGAIFEYGTPDPTALEQLRGVWTRATEAARAAYAGSGPLTPDERRVLLEWRSLDRPLRYREVTELIYAGKSYSSQENRTRRFVDRFAVQMTDGSESEGDPKKLPYRLRDEAVARRIDGGPIETPAATYGGMHPDRVKLRIERLQAELAELLELQKKGG